MVECEVPRKRGRWGNFYLRKCGAQSPPDEGNRWFSAHTMYRHRCCLPTLGGALEDNLNGTADILGKACLSIGSPRKDSSGLVVGPSVSPNRSGGFEYNGAGYDVERVKDNSVVSDPAAFSNVEIRNDTFALEDKASLKSEVIASFYNENKHDSGLNDGRANGVTPSNLNTAVVLEDIAAGFDDRDRKIAGVTVACKLLEVSETRMLYGEDVGPSASLNQSGGFGYSGVGYDIGRVKDNSLVSDPAAFSNVETRNDTFALEDKASLKSEVIVSFCVENKHDTGLNDGRANGVAPSNFNTAVVLEDIAAGVDDRDRKIAGVTVACKLLEFPETRMLYGEDVGPSASPNQSGRFEYSGVGYDVGRVKDNSLVSDPAAFSHVETRNDTVALEDKASLKSEVIARFFNENKHDMGLNNGRASGVTPSNLNTAVVLEDIAAGFDDRDRKVAGVTVTCKLLEVPDTRMLYGEDVLRSTQDCGVSKDQNSYLREKEETTYSTVDDIWGQVCGSQVVILPSTNQCMNEEQSIRKEGVEQVQAIQLEKNPEETQDRSNDSITAKNAYERNIESSPLLKEGQVCLDKRVVQLRNSTDLDGFSPQNCQLDACELVDQHNRAHRTGPILRSRRICLETSIATSVLKKHQKRLSTSSSFKGTIPRKTNFMDNKLKKRVVKVQLEDYLKVWMDKNMQAGDLESEHCLPFLIHAPRRVECYQCKALVSPGKEVICTILNCRRAFHLVCAKNSQGRSWSRKREFKCPQHVCMVCGSRGGLWRCVRCPVTVHKACSPWPEAMTLLRDTPGPAVCWRHHEDWRLDHKCKERTSNIKEAFHRLPIPYLIEDFKIERHFWKDVMGNENESPPYVHIRRNVFLIKKKRDDTDDGVGCSCGRDAIVCAENCECRVQSMSCSKACKCSELCTNKPFRKEKKIKIVKTKFCGWGAEAAEVIKKGEFVIEYIGEVIDDALCEERLWEMKYRGVHNFYMCEIGKDFIIDATFKGNPSRFLNHSCDPNCKLEKWRVDGETRVGIFAAKDIMVGESLTYDYRFIQFGPNVKCRCGAVNCQGDLGEPFGTNGVKNGSSGGVNGESFGDNDPRTPILQILEWGCKRKRS